MSAKPMSEWHGHRSARTPTYHSWRAMRDRCLNPNSTGYEHYGGRGITICKRWDKFVNFLADMGERPEGCTLERSKNDGNYRPGNCVWAPKIAQQNNTRFNHMVTAFGETKSVSEWSRDPRCAVARAALYERLLTGVPVEVAITTPALRGRKLAR